MGTPCKIDTTGVLRIEAVSVVQNDKCPGIDEFLKWFMPYSDQPDTWTNGTYSVYFDAASGTYVLDMGNGIKYKLTYRCDPRFKAIALGVKLGDDECTYDVTITA